jgi:hypothetical protein
MSPSVGLFVVCTSVALGASVVASSVRARWGIGRHFGGATAAASLLVLAAFVAVVARYTATEALTDHVEATVLSVSWVWLRGAPVYTEVDAAETYTLSYGPMLYVTNGLTFRALGPGIASGKVPGALACLGSLAVLLAALRRGVSPAVALAATAGCALALAGPSRGLPSVAFWPRPEPHLLLWTSVGLAAARARGTAAAVVGCGVALGMAFAYKPHGAAYLLPAFALLHRDRGWPAATAAAALAGAVALVPFVAVPGVSLGRYLDWLRLTARHGFARPTFAESLGWVLFMAAPMAAALGELALGDRRGCRAYLRDHAGVILAGAAAVALVLVPASKLGGGLHHVLAFAPVFAFGAATTFQVVLQRAGAASPARHAARALAGGFVLMASLMAVTDQWEYARRLRAASALTRQVLSEADDVRALDPGEPVALGYAGNRTFPLTFTKPAFVFRGEPYFLDAPALMDHLKSGLTIPPRTVAAVRGGRAKVWMLPAGEPPFSMRTFYPDFGPLFSPEFRQAFLESYEIRASTGHFDVWVYKLAGTTVRPPQTP